MENLKAAVERITYANEENGFSVIKVKCAGVTDLVTVVGNMPGINAGSSVEFSGEWKENERYGRQFAVSSYRETMPATLSGIEKYLGSGLIKGVGPVNARRIVRRFRERTLSVIEEHPERLLEIEGIGAKRVEMITRAWQEHREIKNVMIFLQDHGVSTSYAIRIYREYGDASIKHVRENPYRLADDIWGIGFVTADRIAKKMGFPHTSVERCRAGVVYVPGKFSDDGHCYADKGDLLQDAEKILEVGQELIDIAILQLVNEKKLILEPPDKYYLPSLFFSELGTARLIASIVRGDKTAGPLAGPLTAQLSARIEDGIKWTEAASGVRYDDVQKDAVRAAITNRFMVLTGGPGTGKTTTTTAIIAVCERLGLRVMLAAPTGRAAKRMAETSGREAKTVHRLLEYRMPDGYGRNEDNRIECDTLIIDETSMLDIVLTYNLLKAVPPESSVIFVGDKDQLPSVGPGSVLKDLINSGSVCVVELTRIFRQAQSSDIVKNAHLVNNGKMPLIKTSAFKDFFFEEKTEPSEVASTIEGLCSERLPRYFGVNPLEDIQVLCPMTRGDAGTIQLNTALQEILNPNTEKIKFGQTTYKLGDKVMQVRNNYEKNVFNGDIGRITAINNEDRSLLIRFDGIDVDYDITELDEIALAYAITVHKSQGSEYPIVVCPITTQHYMMLQKNLLYTAITRAKRALVLVGTKKAIGIAVNNNKNVLRKTLLAERLRALLYD